MIDPGSAFGTGAHPSTRAALELLQRFEPQPILDLGCGSGVLSIAALKLGFASAHAFDLDPLAVIATGENARAKRGRVTVARADVLADPLPASAAVGREPAARPDRASARALRSAARR